MVLKNRLDLAQYFNELGYKVGAEIGVFGGHYSEILCKAIPGLKLYCIDPWEGYKGYRDHKFESSFNRALAEAHEKLDQYDCEFIQKFSLEAVGGFEDGSLDFVYIDGNHRYDYVRDDINVWAPRVKSGGIVAGDDYYRMPSGNVGVIRAVDEYAQLHKEIEMNIIPEDKVTILAHDDRQPQWWFRQ